MRFPSRYVLLVLAPLALGTGCSSRSLFKSSSGESAFSLKKKDKDGDAIAKADPKADAKGDAEKPDSPKPKGSAARDSSDLAVKDKSAAAGSAAKPGNSKEKTSTEKASTDAASSRLAKAQELEKKGDFDGAARIYREILAEDPKSKASEKGTTRTASTSSDDKPKVLARKPEQTKSDDPWLDDLEPLPSTHPKADKSRATASAGSIAAAKPSAKPDWAKRAADPKTSAGDRKLIEDALQSGDPEELDELADLLDLDDEESPARPANKFAQREAERTAGGAEKPKERPATPASEVAEAAPAWAKNRPAPAETVAEAPASASSSLPWNQSRTDQTSVVEKKENSEPTSSDTLPWKRPEAEKGAIANKETDAPSGEAQSFPWNQPEAKGPAVVSQGAQGAADSAGSDNSRPAWKPTRDAQRELAARAAGPFEKPVGVSEPVEHTVPKQTAAAPVLGETASIPSRAGWNATSLERLCRDCDPLVLAQVKKLDSNYADVRKDGIIELTRMGSIARPAGLALRSMLDDPDPMVQAYAAWGLWELENDTLDSVQVLGGLLGNARPEVVELACYSLGNMGTTASEAVAALEELRDNSHGVERLRAAEALIRVQGADARSVDVLSVAIKSNDRQVRWIAANGLGHVRGPQAGRAVETLTLALSDADPEVQAASALALGGMGEIALNALPKLHELRSSSTPFVRDAADSAIKCLERE